MNDENKTDELKQPVSQSSTAWKGRLFVFLLIAFIVGVQIEDSSPAAQANRDRAYFNAQTTMATETYDACVGTASESECREQARQAAQMAREKLAPMLGR